MSLPALTKTWIFSKNNVITYASLIDTSQRYAYGIKTALMANGWAMKFSASGGVGPASAADTTDRIVNAAAFAPRAAAAAASQGWFVLEDANGTEILVAFQGGSDDVFRISFSRDGFTLAGTTTHQPTATDENVITAGSTVVGATTSGNRVWHIAMTNDAKFFRMFIARAGLVESFTQIGLVAPTVAGSMSPTDLAYGQHVVGDSAITVSNLIGNSAQGGRVRCSGGSGPTVLGSTIPSFAYSSIGNRQPAAQGGGYLTGPVWVWGTSIGADGRFGQVFDFLVGRAAAGSDSGDQYDSSLSWTQIGEFLVGWDGVALPLLAA